MPVGGHKGYGMVLVHEMPDSGAHRRQMYLSRIKSLYQEDENRYSRHVSHLHGRRSGLLHGKKTTRKKRWIVTSGTLNKALKPWVVKEILIPGEPELRIETERLKMAFR